jgi:hypothetical protein
VGWKGSFESRGMECTSQRLSIQSDNFSHNALFPRAKGAAGRRLARATAWPPKLAYHPDADSWALDPRYCYRSARTIVVPGSSDPSRMRANLQNEPKATFGSRGPLGQLG